MSLTLERVAYLSALRADLAAAFAAAKAAAAASTDGGSCNMDQVSIRLSKGTRLDTVQQRVDSRFRRGQWPGEFIIDPGVQGQGAKLTRACEAMAAELRARGWEASVRYLTD